MRPLTMLALCLTVAACRDATEPFRPVDRSDVDQAVLQLTYGPGDDRAPLWSSNGDSVYFTTSSWEGTPLAPSTVVALPADGMGSLTPLLHNVQEGTGRTNWIDAPAVQGDLVAFVRLPPLFGDAPCQSDRRVCPRMSELPMVRLQQGEVHVRALDTTNGLADDLILPLAFEGHSEEVDPSAPTGIITISEYHPFQIQFEVEGRPFFRPSWNPAGTELVVSDGLRLLRWAPGAAAATPIPGTADGVSPAWSPGGEWIAYTRHEKLAADTFMCDYESDVMVPNVGIVTIISCVERRIAYETTPPQIVLVRPDGSEEIVLAEGEDPAWSPDGAFIYASSTVGGGEHIVRIPLAGGNAELIPDTDGGVEPAVSPDGRRLAFARRSDLGATRNIWVVQLP